MKPFIDRRIITQFDITLLLITSLIIGCGLIGLYSATHIQQSVTYEIIFKKQLIWIAVGFVTMTVISFINYPTIGRYAYIIYAISIILLILVFFVGKYVQGSRRWISFGFFVFQPSELSKFAVILTLSKLISSKSDPNQGALPYKVTFLCMAMIFLPVFLILVEPDLGSAVIVLMIGFSILILNKMKLRILLVMLLIASLLSPLLWAHMKDYQKRRIKTFLDPNLDPTGAGYHINQSKIAIGSGEITGKGFMKGTQTKLHYLPEHYTDFIFSHIAEEWGFVGALSLIGLYVLLILRCLNIGLKSKDTLGYNLSMGAALLFFWHSIVNLGMVTGLLPVVGVPLTLVSYGGSSVFTGMVCLGLAQSVAAHRFYHK